ncbi:MAG: polysaccharide biosynthesis/export family protein [Bacteroidales bacterium]
MEKRFSSYYSRVKVITSGLILSFILFSCVNQRNLEYMRISKMEPPSYKEADNPEYKLQPGDALYIQINSIDDAASNVFAQSSASLTMDPYAAYMQSYVVDQSGSVQLPVIGDIVVGGKTTNEVSEEIKASLKNVLSLPVVTVKLVNQYVSILGEVIAPGHFVFSQEKFTIYNALSMAGDISINGNRREVTVIRNENGINNRIILDLTREDILSSPYYYIQPNDIIYVKPLRKRYWGMENFPVAEILSIITTALLVYSIFQ